MTEWQLPHLYAVLTAESPEPWRWQLADERGRRVWALVQDDEDGGVRRCGVYAIGPHLTLQARAFAMVTPGLLLEVSQRVLLQQECIERVLFLETLIKRRSLRARQEKQPDAGDDFQRVLTELVVIRWLLSAPELPNARELAGWEREAESPCAQPDAPAGD